jgi:hypothetical protein
MEPWTVAFIPNVERLPVDLISIKEGSVMGHIATETSNRGKLVSKYAME